MKKIEPIQIWSNGQLQTAEFLNVSIVADNLKSQANFFYQLFETDQSQLPVGLAIAQGNITMSGSDYENWNNDPSINDAAYIWVASKLGLTLI